MKTIIDEDMKKVLDAFFKENSSPELITTYLFYVEKSQHVEPALYTRGKVIYQSADKAIKALEKEEKLWREVEIQVRYGDESVNDKTKKIYICPFTGKVFGDNTHPNPQDAIYDWVAHCPENKERVGGLPVKRFYISEDPDVIKSYLDKAIPQKVVTKVVYSSPGSGKLFYSQQQAIEDFKKTYLKPVSLAFVQSQNKYHIEESFLDFIQKELDESKIASFIEACAEVEEYQPLIEKWLK